jgi:hypothetical protein
MKRNIYVLKNYNLKEIHYGSTSQRLREQFKLYREGANPTVAHWNWEDHNIDCSSVKRHVFAPIAFIQIVVLKRSHRSRWKVI